MTTITNVNRHNRGISLKIEGLAEAARLFNPLATQEAIRQAMDEGTDVALEALREVTPVSSGKTRDGWRKLMTHGASITIVNNRPAAALLFFGAKPHAIYPVEGKALSNINNKRSQVYGPFGPRKNVMHPGFNAPDRYVQAIDYQVGEAAFEVASRQILKFYAHDGTLQRRTLGGQFGRGF